MKAKLIPVYFESADDPDFTCQLSNLERLLWEEIELLTPVSLGDAYPRADAVVFPQMLGSAYRRLSEIKAISLPILVITSEFATMSMWDWEIIRYLREEGVQVIAPYSLEQAKVACR